MDGDRWGRVGSVLREKAVSGVDAWGFRKIIPWREEQSKWKRMCPFKLLLDAKALIL